MWINVDAAVTVPVNAVALIDDGDFKSREESVTFNQAGLDLVWNFVTTAGVQTQTAVTPTDTGGAYDWVNVGNGMYNIEIPATGGGTINNDTEGFGWFSGFATGVLPWSGPIIGFRAAGLNDKLCNWLYSPYRGLAGTALPNANADAAFGLPTSDAGGLDLDNRMISAAATAALEDQYDGTGLLGDTYPLRQDQGASISGGLAVRASMASVTVISGSQQDLANTTASDGAWWTGDDDGAGAEFIFLCTPADTTAEPGDLHFEGYYDEPAGNDNGATISVYNFQSAAWESHVTLSKATADEIHDVSLTHANGAPGSGTLEGVAYVLGDVLIKLEQDTQETGNACLLIDRMYVGFISAAVTATEIVDEWETQSQADPTGFHVNVLELNSVSQSLLDLVDFADAGYDPGTNKVQGVVLVDTVTTYTGNTLQTADVATLIATVGVAGTGLTAINLPNQTMDITGNLSGSVGSVTADVTTDAASRTASKATGFSTHTAANVVDEWETQSQADPTGFHTNVLEVAGTAQTANDNGADINAILVDTAAIGAAGAGLTDLGGMSTGMKTEVNAEVVDTLATDTYAEPGQGTPGATVSLAAKIGYLFKAWRNKSTQTATEYDLYNDDAATVDQKATVSDDATTATKGEIETGP